MRNTLFICHANPEDNEFALWITSRLQLIGYKVWCDLEGLIGGEKFWSEIDNEIRNKTIKFLLVFSNSVCIIPGKLKDGIDKEFNLAESISKDLSIKDFIIPLNIDEQVAFNAFIGITRYNHITFYNNWALGFKQLIKKLERDNIVKDRSVVVNEIITNWYKNEFTTKFGLYPKRETYYSNRWPVNKLPEYLFIYQHDSEEQAKLAFPDELPYPIIRHGNVLVTFVENLHNITNQQYASVTPTRIYKIESNNILQGFQSEQFPTLVDAQNLLKWLLNSAFHLLMKNRGLFWYEMANKRNCYYFPINKLFKNKVRFKYPNRTKTKNLVGKYKSSFWHFGISSKTILDPYIFFSTKSHILFSDNGYQIWDDKRKLHAARRSRGKTWFNEEWRDHLIAFIHAMKDKNGKIEINMNEDFVLRMPTMTKSFFSKLGYNEPESKDRQSMLNIDEEEYEIIQDIEM